MRIGEFSNVSGLGNFWSTTESPISNIEVLILDYGTSTTSFTPFGKGFGMSVRCLKNSCVNFLNKILDVW